jgi:hypothetical protein
MSIEFHRGVLTERDCHDKISKVQKASVVYTSFQMHYKMDVTEDKATWRGFNSAKNSATVPAPVAGSAVARSSTGLAFHKMKRRGGEAKPKDNRITSHRFCCAATPGKNQREPMNGLN